MHAPDSKQKALIIHVVYVPQKHKGISRNQSLGCDKVTPSRCKQMPPWLA